MFQLLDNVVVDLVWRVLPLVAWRWHAENGEISVDLPLFTHVASDAFHGPISEWSSIGFPEVLSIVSSFESSVSDAFMNGQQEQNMSLGGFGREFRINSRWRFEWGHAMRNWSVTIPS